MRELFADLPDALVRDLLLAARPVAEEVGKLFSSLQSARAEWRSQAQHRSLVRRKADLEITREPSVVGIDGSYQLHRLTSLDLCAAAAVAVEGTAKEAHKHWQEPYHRVWIGTVPHHEATSLVLRGLMVAMELELACQAPHDLVLIDGSFASLIIYLNQGLANVTTVPSVGQHLRRRWEEGGLFHQLLRLIRSDRTIAVPKYTSRNELAGRISGAFPATCDGRTLATMILEPGEYTTPLPVYTGEEYHLPKDACSESEQRALNEALWEVHVIYYRPFGWAPALRLEVPGPVAHSSVRLSLALQGIASQFFSPAVVEPYPLFLADRMVKSLSAGVAVVEQTIAQQVTDGGLDVELTMLLLQNYRTEGGRGGV